MIGTFADPVADGSMAIFRSRAAAEEFRAADPFVLEGLVGESRILDWDPWSSPPPDGDAGLSNRRKWRRRRRYAVVRTELPATERARARTNRKHPYAARPSSS